MNKTDSFVMFLCKLRNCLLLSFLFLINSSYAYSFCQTPCSIDETQFSLDGSQSFAGIVQSRYLIVLSDGNYIHALDSYNKKACAEIILSGMPVDGFVETGEKERVWLVLNQRKLCVVDVSSPAPELWNVTNEIDLPCIPTAIAPVFKNQILSKIIVGVLGAEGPCVVIYDVANLTDEPDLISIPGSGAISDMIVNSNTLFLTLEALGQIMSIDIDTKQIIAKADSGASPASIFLDTKENNIWIANTLSDTVTVLDAETLGLVTSIYDANILTGPSSVFISNDIVYVGGGSGSSGSLATISAKDMIFLEQSLKLSRNVQDIWFNSNDNTLYIADHAGVYYVFAESCLRIMVQQEQGIWEWMFEVLTKPDKDFNVRIQGGKSPFDIPSQGSAISCELDPDDSLKSTFNCKALHTGTYPLMFVDANTNSRTLVVRSQESLSIDPKGPVTVEIGSEPVIFTAKGGFEPLSWWTQTGILSTTTGRSVVYFPPDVAGDDFISVKDRTGNLVQAAIVVELPFLTITPAQAVLFPGQTKTFYLIGSDSGSYEWQATIGELQEIDDGMEYTAPDVLADAQIIVRNRETGDSAIAKVWIISDALTISPSQVLLERDQGQAFRVTGGKEPYIWSVGAGDLDTNKSSSVIYTAPNITGPVEIKVTDSIGQISTASISVQGNLYISPAISVVLPSEQITLNLIGAAEPVGWKAEEGIFIEQTKDKAVYQAPYRTGRFDVIALDDKGEVAWSRVMVADDKMYIQTDSSEIVSGEHILLNVQGGVAPLQWSASQGTLTTTSGTVTTWVSPVVNETTKVNIQVQDSRGICAIKEMTIINDKDALFTGSFYNVPDSPVGPKQHLIINATCEGNDFIFFAAVQTPDLQLFFITDTNQLKAYQEPWPLWQGAILNDITLLDFKIPDIIAPELIGKWNIYLLLAPASAPYEETSKRKLYFHNFQIEG